MYPANCAWVTHCSWRVTSAGAADDVDWLPLPVLPAGVGLLPPPLSLPLLLHAASSSAAAAPAARLATDLLLSPVIVPPVGLPISATLPTDVESVIRWPAPLASRR